MIPSAQSIALFGRFNLCASFQRAVVETVVDRLRHGLRMFRERFGAPSALVASGGVAANGAIRAAIAHGVGLSPDMALHFSIENISLTRLDRTPHGWRVACVNELAGI